MKTDTYKRHVFVDLEIINKHSQHIKNTFNIAFVEVNKFSPRIYWQSKLHKNPATFRYIMAASVSSKHIESCNNKCRFLTRSNTLNNY